MLKVIYPINREEDVYVVMGYTGLFPQDTEWMTNGFRNEEEADGYCLELQQDLISRGFPSDPEKEMKEVPNLIDLKDEELEERWTGCGVEYFVKKN